MLILKKNPQKTPHFHDVTHVHNLSVGNQVTRSYITQILAEGQSTLYFKRPEGKGRGGGAYDSIGR